MKTDVDKMYAAYVATATVMDVIDVRNRLTHLFLTVAADVAMATTAGAITNAIAPITGRVADGKMAVLRLARGCPHARPGCAADDRGPGHVCRF